MKKEAKSLALKIWGYFIFHPRANKINLPYHIYKLSYKLLNNCPLCEIYFTDGATCPDCPLKSCNENSLYNKWYKSEKLKSYYAFRIWLKIKLWKTEE